MAKIDTALFTDFGRLCSLGALSVIIDVRHLLSIYRSECANHTRALCQSRWME